jgi:hypothetical protein
MVKPLWLRMSASLALAAASTFAVGCSGAENVQLKDVGYTLQVEPKKKIEDLPKSEQPRKGQSSSRIKRDPSRPRSSD